MFYFSKTKSFSFLLLYLQKKLKNMKRICKILAIIAVFALSVQPLSSQETKKWDARLGLGVFGMQDIIPLLVVGLGEYVTDDVTSLSQYISIGTPSLEMSYECNKHISVGAQITLGFASESYKYNQINQTGYTSIIYPTIMANLKANYFIKNNFSMYGLFGLGATNYFAIENDPTYSSTSLSYFVIPNFNFYPLCFSTNRDNGFYMEVGYGSKGYLNLGWEIKIKSKEQ